MSSVMSNYSQSTLIWGGGFRVMFSTPQSTTHCCYHQGTVLVSSPINGFVLFGRARNQPQDFTHARHSTKLHIYPQLPFASSLSILPVLFPRRTNTQYLLSYFYELWFIKSSSTSQLASFISPSVEQVYPAICPSEGTFAPVEKSQTGREHCF